MVKTAVITSAVTTNKLLGGRIYGTEILHL